jgi:serine/threonine-protein kinase HipA
MTENIEVFIDFDLGLKRVGTLYRHARSNGEALSFEYHPDWLNDNAIRFSLEPSLTLNAGAFTPGKGLPIFGSLGDSAPDTWGRRLMQRAERQLARQENRAVRTLMEADYLLGVSDMARMGALRFRRVGEAEFQSPRGVPPMMALGQLLGITERILRDEETEEDIQMIFAPGSSLGGARPKASLRDQHGRLVVAKFPKETDDYSMEAWEAVALHLAKQAGINTPRVELETVAQKKVLLSYRFDRSGAMRIPFLSAMSLMGLKDGEQGSYPEIVDVLTEHGAQSKTDAHELYRRMVLNVLISNVDDHLRNHGFLWKGQGGWQLSPVYDLNPTPTDVRKRVLTTHISPDEGTCDIDLVLSVAEFFSLELSAAKRIVREVANVTAAWRSVAESFGIHSREISRMESAFEHADLNKALKL